MVVYNSRIIILVEKTAYIHVINKMVMLAPTRSNYLINCNTPPHPTPLSPELRAFAQHGQAPFLAIVFVIRVFVFIMQLFLPFKFQK